MKAGINKNIMNQSITRGNDRSENLFNTFKGKYSQQDDIFRLESIMVDAKTFTPDCLYFAYQCLAPESHQLLTHVILDLHKEKGNHEFYVKTQFIAHAYKKYLENSCQPSRAFPYWLKSIVNGHAATNKNKMIHDLYGNNDMESVQQYKNGKIIILKWLSRFNSKVCEERNEKSSYKVLTPYFKIADKQSKIKLNSKPEVGGGEFKKHQRITTLIS